MQKVIRKEKEHTFRRGEIMRAAEEVFAAKGFFKTTIAEIADASGFAVGTLYQFFEGKEQLFTAMMEEKLAIFYDEIRSAVQGQKSPVEKIQALVRAHFNFVENNLSFCSILIRREHTSLAGGSASLRDRMIDDYLDHITFIETIMGEGLKQKMLKEFPPRMMAYALSGMINSVTYSRINNPCGVLQGELSDRLIELFLQGVASGAP